MFRYGGRDESELSKEELAQVLQNTVPGIALVCPHPDGIKLLYTNDGFFDIFGYTRDEYEETSLETRLSFFDMSDFMGIITKINSDYSQDDAVSFQCRINKKGGEKGWVLISFRKFDSTGIKLNIYNENTFVCNIVDITESKRMEKLLLEEKQKYEIIQELSEAILFTYDVKNDVLECSKKIQNTFGGSTRYENAFENITYGNVIDRRDVQNFIGAFSNAMAGKKINVLEARILDRQGYSVWCRIKFSAVYNRKGEAIKFIGTVTDIDKEKQEKQRLISQAERDQLTGFLNKISTGLRFNQVNRLSDNSQAAMFIIDIDDFKKLNDTYGHSAGDVFLKRFTQNLAEAFTENDVLGRIGGEEFLIYSQYYGQDEIIKKAESILNSCRRVRLEQVPDKEFTCSVGIALYPDDSEGYQELYEKADKALYAVKTSGKNNYKFFAE
ncbi:MAG: diguanylate cyclase domain-containing protein [Acutalibacteraceae bacterium]